MTSNLVDLRIHNFQNQTNGETINGYLATFIIPGRNNEYPPSCISFFVSERDPKGFGQVFKTILEDSPYITVLEGFGKFEIGFSYDKTKIAQKLTFLKKIK